MNAAPTTPKTFDDLCWDEAKARLGPGANFREIAALAQKIKTVALNPPDPAADWRDVLAGFVAWMLIWFVIGIALHHYLK